LSILCPNFRTKLNDRRNRTSFAPLLSKEKASSSSSLPLGAREPTENPANSAAQLLLSGRLDGCQATGGAWPSSDSRGVALHAPSPEKQDPYARHLTEIRNSLLCDELSDRPWRLLDLHVGKILSALCAAFSTDLQRFSMVMTRGSAWRSIQR
jgi:hypothetical protein